MKTCSNCFHFSNASRARVCESNLPKSPGPEICSLKFRYADEQSLLTAVAVVQSTRKANTRAISPRQTPKDFQKARLGTKPGRERAFSLAARWANRLRSRLGAPPGRTNSLLVTTPESQMLRLLPHSDGLRKRVDRESQRSNWSTGTAEARNTVTAELRPPVR